MKSLVSALCALLFLSSSAWAAPYMMLQEYHNGGSYSSAQDLDLGIFGFNSSYGDLLRVEFSAASHVLAYRRFHCQPTSPDGTCTNETLGIFATATAFGELNTSITLGPSVCGVGQCGTRMRAGSGISFTFTDPSDLAQFIDPVGGVLLFENLLTFSSFGAPSCKTGTCNTLTGEDFGDMWAGVKVVAKYFFETTLYSEEYRNKEIYHVDLTSGAKIPSGYIGPGYVGVPEPSTGVFLIFGVFGISALAYRRGKLSLL